MQISFAASECTPFAKTGGLADVVGAFPRELVKLGHQVSVYLPFYVNMRSQLAGDFTYAVRSITIPFQHYKRKAGILEIFLIRRCKNPFWERWRGCGHPQPNPTEPPKSSAHEI